ncbi:hypothetical protein B0H11DRAFT_2293919 [Mycena galericulata]|nr:hypothetical protein B0H11DRAFT_2293919 [Mycena galericulata]
MWASVVRAPLTLLAQVQNRRSVVATDANESSSRSHSMFTPWPWRERAVGAGCLFPEGNTAYIIKSPSMRHLLHLYHSDVSLVDLAVILEQDLGPRSSSVMELE